MRVPEVIVSVAHSPHISTWEVTANALMRHFTDSEIFVIVPDSDVRNFRAVTDNAIRVVPETKVVGKLAKVLRKRIGTEARSRFGWYLQQFIKLEFIASHSPGNDTLIWDADTVPLRPINFYGPNDSVYFFQGKGLHQPYLDQLSRLWGRPCKTEISFVAQTMLVPADWMEMLVRDLEDGTGKPWWRRVIDSIDFSERSGFSEYEMLGNYFSMRFPSQVSSVEGKWDRNGWNHFSSGAETLKTGGLVAETLDLDFVAFELWQKPQ